MSAKPTLVIPFKFGGIEEAIAALQKLGPIGKTATADIAEGTAKSNIAFDVLHKGVSDITGMVSGLATVGATLSTVGQVFTVINQQAREGVEWMKQQVEQFSSLREQMRQIQSIQGKMPTSEAARELIGRAEQAKIVTPEEQMQFEKAFIQYSSPYMDTAGKPGTGKLSQATIDEMIPEMSAVAKAKDVRPETAGKVISTIIKAMPAGTSAEKYKEIYMGLMGVAETSKGSAEITASQFLELGSGFVGKGKIFGEGEEGLQAALRMLGVQQEVRPGEGGMMSKDLARSLMQMDEHHVSAQYGITEGMTAEQQVAKLREAWQKSGEKDPLRFVHGLLKGRGSFEGAQALSTAITAGIDEGAFAKMQAGYKGAPKPSDYLAEFRASDAGRAMETETGTKRAGEMMASTPWELEWAHQKAEAKRELTVEGRFTPEGHTWGDTQKGFTEGLPAWMGGGRYGGRDELTIRQRALAELAQKYMATVPIESKEHFDSRAHGEFERNRFDQYRGTGWRTDSSGHVSASMVTEAEARAESKRLLEAIAKNTRPATPPLAAPPPQPATRTR